MVIDGARNWISTAGREMADFVFPRGCAACDAPTDDRDLALCGGCAAELAAWVSRPYCTCCGEDVGPHLIRDGRCTACQRRRVAYERVARVGRHRETLRSLILRYKFAREVTLDALLGDLLTDAAQGMEGFADAHMLVPIPSPRLRTWMRGFSPVQLLARRVSHRTGKPVVDALRLTRRILEQKSLHADDRVANVNGAFAVRSPEWVRGAVVCLVDDVMTTGSTLAAAARALRKAGAQRVCAAVLSTAMLGEDRAV